MRINIDSEALHSGKIKKLARLCGEAYPTALGRLVFAWAIAYQNAETLGVVSAAEVDLESELDGFASKMVEAGLATDQGDGMVLLHGVEKRTTFIRENRARAVRGGAANKERLRKRFEETADPANPVDPIIDSIVANESEPNGYPVGSPTSSPTASPNEAKGASPTLSPLDLDLDPALSPAPAPRVAEARKARSAREGQQKDLPVEGHAETVAAFHDRFIAQSGVKPTWGAKQGAMIKTLVKRWGAPEVQRRIAVLFDGQGPSFLSGPHDLETLVQHFDKLAVPAARAGRNPTSDLLDWQMRRIAESEANEAAERAALEES